MKIIPILLVFSFSVLLALPEVTGAPAQDAIVYEKRAEEQNSKSRKKTMSEETDMESERNTCANGLVSARKEFSVTKEMTEEELENSRKSLQVKTATGSSKAEESAKKKTLISANSKQSVVVYYLVSYKRLPPQKPNECKKTYYKRVFPKEKNTKVFYHKVFKVYEGEEPKQYIERIEYIFDKVYPELDCRLDVNYIDFFDHYYTQKYFRKINEKDEHYFARIFKRLDGEPFKKYQRRMQCLEASLDEEDFEHVTFVDTEKGYVVGQRKRPVTSVSSPKSSGIKYGNFRKEKKKFRKQARSLNQSSSLELEKSNKGSSVKAQRNLHSTREVIEKEEEINCFSYKVAYTKLPKKKIGQSDEDYYREFFGEYNPKMTKDQRNELYLRLLIQYKGEESQEYVQRIDYLFDKVYPKLDIRANKLLVSMLEHYYREKYLKRANESEEQWFSRILLKEPKESVEHYKNRVFCLETVFQDDANWSRVVILPKSKTGFSIKPLVKKAVAPKPITTAPKDDKKCGCAKS